MYLACTVLVLMAGLFSFWALLATGGDSSFAGKSDWIYLPWLVALVLTLAAVIATATGHDKTGLTLIVAAAVAYTATRFTWERFTA